MLQQMRHYYIIANNIFTILGLYSFFLCFHILPILLHYSSSVVHLESRFYFSSYEDPVRHSFYIFPGHAANRGMNNSFISQDFF